MSYLLPLILYCIDKGLICTDLLLSRRSNKSKNEKLLVNIKLYGLLNDSNVKYIISLIESNKNLFWLFNRLHRIDLKTANYINSSGCAYILNSIFSWSKMSLIVHTYEGIGGDEAKFFVNDYKYIIESLLALGNYKCISSNSGVFIYDIPVKTMDYNMFMNLVTILNEGPVIRVQREPSNCKGRMHTSTICSFHALVPVRVDDRKIIDSMIKEMMSDKYLEFDTFRCSGAGGQHVNKTDSGIRARHKLLDITTQCTEERSQHANKQTAIRKMQKKILDDINIILNSICFKHKTNTMRCSKNQTFHYKRSRIDYHDQNFFIAMCNMKPIINYVSAISKHILI